MKQKGVFTQSAFKHAKRIDILDYNNWFELPYEGICIYTNREPEIGYGSKKFWQNQLSTMSQISEQALCIIFSF